MMYIHNGTETDSIHSAVEIMSMASKTPRQMRNTELHSCLTQPTKTVTVPLKGK